MAGPGSVSCDVGLGGMDNPGVLVRGGLDRRARLPVLCWWSWPLGGDPFSDTEKTMKR